MPQEWHALQARHLFMLIIHPASQDEPHNTKDIFELKPHLQIGRQMVSRGSGPVAYRAEAPLHEHAYHIKLPR